MLPIPSGCYYNVFVDLSIPWSGTCIGWGFYAERSGWYARYMQFAHTWVSIKDLYVVYVFVMAYNGVVVVIHAISS